jgi:hypothetical protein
MEKNIPNYHKIYQMSIKYSQTKLPKKHTNILHCKTLRNFPKFGFLGLKI